VIRTLIGVHGDNQAESLPVLIKGKPLVTIEFLAVPLRHLWAFIEGHDVVVTVSPQGGLEMSLAARNIRNTDRMVGACLAD